LAKTYFCQHELFLPVQFLTIETPFFYRLAKSICYV